MCAISLRNACITDTDCIPEDSVVYIRGRHSNSRGRKWPRGPHLATPANVRFLSCDGHQLYERGVDLEIEGVRYIEMHRGPAAYVLGPPPSRSRDLELEGGVIACHVDYVYESSSPKTPTCDRGTE